MTDFIKTVRFFPATDRRNDPKGNYGIHGVDLDFVLTGPAGGIEWIVYTNWQLPHVQRETDQNILSRAKTGLLDSVALDTHSRPSPSMLSAHSFAPFDRRNKKPSRTDCGITGGNCWTKPITYLTKPIFESLLKEGDEGVWACLEHYYHEVFDKIVKRNKARQA
jgi:hypothetical protein